jgi:hypothetical protein
VFSTQCSFMSKCNGERVIGLRRENRLRNWDDRDKSRRLKSIGRGHLRLYTILSYKKVLQG